MQRYGKDFKNKITLTFFNKLPSKFCMFMVYKLKNVQGNNKYNQGYMSSL